MYRYLTLFALSCLGTVMASTAWAAPLGEKAIVADCYGTGVNFYLSSHPRDQLAISSVEVFGIAPPSSPDAIFVVDRRTNTYRWDSRPRRTIARECGSENDELALFQGIQPKSGLWQAKLGETKLTGCPSMMQQAFPKSPGALPAEWKTPRRVVFEVPFHPDQLEMTRSFEAGMKSKVVWKQVADDTWQTEVFPELFGQLSAGEGKGSKMTWRLAVKDEGRIEHDTTLSIVLPAEAAAALGAGKDCRMTSHNIWQRVGE
ncbi:hypothetical protein [Rhizobium sp. L1K21]|uniref:hypothetical protein n=1 Tax=Rhizobium sp. L1K21 TaxID=2954933 RepID=UPI0020937604|nr:hypothetical protein [Rhizobium sp. L1K21]MCO6187042.1 hypothetical protein [Rhizobium sp. L1K21]